MLYFLLHDAAAFSCISAALASSWRRRHFAPIIKLASNLQPAFADFAARFHLTAEESPLLTRLTLDRPFDRRLWRHLAGEVLLYAAADIPAIQTDAELLGRLVAANQRTFLQQAHVGSCDLEFDGVPYRPGRAGLNDATDVARLANALGGIDPANWRAAVLDDDDPTEALAFARECLTGLRSVYEQAQQRGQVVVCEDI